MAVNPQNRKDIKDTLKVFEDGLNSVVASFSSRLKESFKDIDDNIASGIAKNLGRGIINDLNAAIRLSDKQVENEEKLKRGQLKSRDVEKDLLQISLKRARANQNQEELLKALRDEQYKAQIDGDQERSDSLARQIEKIKEEKAIADGILDSREKSGKEQLEVSQDIEASTGNLGELFRRLAKNKFFGSLINAEGAMEGMKKKAFELRGKKGAQGIAGGFSIAKAGIKGMFQGLTKAALVFGAIAKVLSEIVKLFIRGDKLTTDIAKNFGISKEQASGLLVTLRDTNIQLGESNFNLEQMINGQKALVETQRVITASSFSQAKNMATLTDRMGISAENAGMLLTYTQASGVEFEDIFNRVSKIAQKTNEVNGNGVTAQMIFQEVAQTSADILANFGFQFDEIGKAVGATRRFGVSLTQARNIANGLLDFEQSIGAELEAEILLGRQFNFERARALAATGDIAGATEEVLKQTQNLNDEQLRSPIIQQAIAKATGLSADEFLRARKLQQALINDRGELQKLLDETTDSKKRALIEEGILGKQSFKQIQANLTAQEQFNNAIQNVKDQFIAINNTGVLEGFVQILPGVLSRLAALTGQGGKLQSQNKLEDSIKQGLIDLGYDPQKDKEVFDEAIQKATKLNREYEGRRDKINEGLFLGGFGDFGISAAYNEGTRSSFRDETVYKLLDDIKKEMQSNTRATRDNNYNNITN